MKMNRGLPFIEALNMRTLLAIALALLPATLAAAQTKLLRHPTIANGKVAFSYLGSIWMANEDGSNVQRLTVNQAQDVFRGSRRMGRRSPSRQIARAITTCM